MKAFREIRNIQEGAPEEKIIKKQEAIKRILNAYRIGKLEKSDANERLRRRGHNGIQESKADTELCPRILAIYKPGESMPGVHHSFAYNGKVPNTSSKVCHLCGQREEDVLAKMKPVKEEIVKEEVPEATKKKSLKTFRGARTATGQPPNPIDTDPTLTLNKTVKSMNRMGF